jgi:DNA-binding NarL/FixJ family response regulator
MGARAHTAPDTQRGSDEPGSDEPGSDEPGSDEPGSDERGSGGGMIQEAPTRVLLVDDHRMFAELVAASLSAEPDFEIVGMALSGRAAVTMAVELAPDLILLDFALPGEDGLAVATRLQEAVPGVRVVMLTGQQDESLLRSAFACGCAGFVTKDQAVDHLIDAIRAVRAGRVVLDADLTARLAAPPPKLGLGSRLTRRELEVLELLGYGVTTRDIASRLFISVNTARNHVQRLIAKLGAHSRLEAVAIARRSGLIDTVGRS